MQKKKAKKEQSMFFYSKKILAIEAEAFKKIKFTELSINKERKNLMYNFILDNKLWKKKNLFAQTKLVSSSYSNVLISL